MLTPIPDLPEGLAGLTASGTVTAGDVPGALDGLGTPEALVVIVEKEFDGYMSELVHGLRDAAAKGRPARCALVVPDAMLSEARLAGTNGGFRAFPASEQAHAETWARG